MPESKWSESYQNHNEKCSSYTCPGLTQFHVLLNQLSNVGRKLSNKTTFAQFNISRWVKGSLPRGGHQYLRGWRTIQPCIIQWTSPEGPSQEQDKEKEMPEKKIILFWNVQIMVLWTQIIFLNLFIPSFIFLLTLCWRVGLVGLINKIWRSMAGSVWSAPCQSVCPWKGINQNFWNGTFTW